MREVGQWTLLAFGALMVVGGILGYVLPRKPSKVSLIAGGVSGLLSIAAFFLSRGPRSTFGLGMGLVVAAGVAVMMFLRYKETGKYLPSGLIAMVSAAVAVIVVVALSLP